MDVSRYRDDWEALVSTDVSDKNTTWFLFGVDEEGGRYSWQTTGCQPKSFALFLDFFSHATRGGVGI